MPGPLDILKKGWNVATTPLVDKETIAPLQDMMDAPALDRSPTEARIRGFGAGALEGLRGFTSPLDIASFAAPAVSGMFKGAAGAARAAGPTMDLVHPNTVKQVAPAMDEVGSLISDMQRNLAKIPDKAAPAAQTLGQRAPEFATGSEAVVNAGRGAGGANPMDGLYEHLMKTFGGRGPG